MIAQDEQVAGTFDLCVAVLPPAPGNDLCTNATELTCPAGANLQQDATFATGNGVDCNGDAIGPGIWYRHVGTGNFITLSVAPNEWDAEIQVWTGADCQSLTCMMNVDDATTGGTETIENLQTTQGTVYYFYVGAFAQNERAGTFTLNLTCMGDPPANIVCEDNPVNDPCNNVSVEEGSIEGTVEACQTIVTTGDVLVESGTTTNFKAGTSITLRPGFTAEAGSTFRAYIEDCVNNPLSRPEEVLAEAKKTGIEDPIAGMSVEVTPNPVLDASQVRVYLPLSGTMEARLTNIHGQVLRTWQQDAESGWNAFQLDRRNLTDGWYFLTVQTEIEQVVTNIVFAQ